MMQMLKRRPVIVMVLLLSAAVSVVWLSSDLLAAQRGQPTPVRDVDNPVQQPVEITFDETMPNGAGQTTCPVVVYTVPAGKRLVIEYVNLFGIGPRAPVQSLGFSIYRNPSVSHYFVTVQRGDSQIGSLFYTLSESTRIYFGHGEAVSLCAFRGSIKTDFMTARAKLSGYLVDVP